MLKTALVFQSHMILQREKPLKVWGTADAGMQVEISIQGQKAVCTAGETGNWCAQLAPLKASEQEEMMIRSGDYRWKVQSTTMQPAGTRVGMTIVPYNIHIMHKAKTADAEIATESASKEA